MIWAIFVWLLGWWEFLTWKETEGWTPQARLHYELSWLTGTVKSFLLTIGIVVIIDLCNKEALPGNG
jgi:hypothetical protein